MQSAETTARDSSQLTGDERLYDVIVVGSGLWLDLLWTPT
jgi:hypothetical protein